MADRIGVMYLGRLVEVSDSKALFRAPRHPFTRMLLDAVPDLGMTGRQRRWWQGKSPTRSIRPRAAPSTPAARSPMIAAARGASVIDGVRLPCGGGGRRAP